MQPRVVWIFVAIACLYVILSVRLIYVQIFRHAYFQHEADTYRINKNILPGARGQILDRNGDPLALNVPCMSIYADPMEVRDRSDTAKRLAVLLDDKEARLTTLLTPISKRSHYVSLKRRVSCEVGTAIVQAKLPGIGVAADTKRSYPKAELAAQVLGFTDIDGKGIEGIERSQNALLQGRDGRIVGEVDRDGRFLPGTLREDRKAASGHDLVLTLDTSLQQKAEAELAKAVQQYHARNGVVVVLDPKTGEILALANSPSYNPNFPRPQGSVSKEAVLKLTSFWRNRAVSDLYEPGSTLKTITTAAVLQELGSSMADVHVYCGRTLKIGNQVIHDAQDPPYYGLCGDQTLRGILKVSSNIGMAQFGLRLGENHLYEYEQKFGFLDYPHSDLPGEQKSWLQSPQQYDRFRGGMGWSKMQIANISFGQGISITPLQLAAAYGAIANNGLLMRPHILHSIRTDSGETFVAPTVIRQVIAPVVAVIVRSMLGTVVQDGTGKPAQIAGFSMGGKTGSAQIAGAHGYEAGHYVASFVGLVPLHQPRLVILCSIFEPERVHWGATVAAPVVHNIAKAAMLQMHVTPDSPDAIDWDDHLKSSNHQHERIVQLWENKP